MHTLMNGHKIEERLRKLDPLERLETERGESSELHNAVKDKRAFNQIKTAKGIYIIL